MNIWDRPLDYEFKFGEKIAEAVASDKGFEPFFAMRDILTNEYGLTLTNQYGITDMQAFFEFGKYQIILLYYSPLDMVILQSDLPESEVIQLREFRKIATALYKIGQQNIF